MPPDDDERWSRLRAAFYLPPEQIYLDGNSLGLLCRPAESALAEAVTAWKHHGIGAWNEAGWIDLPERVATLVAPLLGATGGAIALTGQTTSNLHQLLATLYQPAHPDRRVMVADELNFASDHHAITSHLRLRGLDPARHEKRVTSADGATLTTEEVIATFTSDVQLAVFSSVLYVSGQLLDMATITRAARDRGIMIGWDLSHSIGVIPHGLEAIGADFAFWCNYKYLNAGPGAIGGLFLHPRHHDQVPGLAGWWGVNPSRRFTLATEHDPAAGAARLQIGTPPILSLAPLAGALTLFAEAGGIDAVRARSLRLTDQLLSRFHRDLVGHGFELITPIDAPARGGHVALRHPAAGQICPALRAAGVVPDYRHPGVLRLAPSPFYTQPTEIDAAIDRLVEVMQSQAYQNWPAVETAAP